MTAPLTKFRVSKVGKNNTQIVAPTVHPFDRARRQQLGRCCERGRYVIHYSQRQTIRRDDMDVVQVGCGGKSGDGKTATIPSDWNTMSEASAWTEFSGRKRQHPIARCGSH